MARNKSRFCERTIHWKDVVNHSPKRATVASNRRSSARMEDLWSDISREACWQQDLALFGFSSLSHHQPPSSYRNKYWKWPKNNKLKVVKLSQCSSSSSVCRLHPFGTLFAKVFWSDAGPLLAIARSSLIVTSIASISTSPVIYDRNYSLTMVSAQLAMAELAKPLLSK